MRPTDEHQPGSTRPSFLSVGRRAPLAEDNILARLERDGKRNKSGEGGQSWLSARLAWSALAGVAVVGLIGALASLAQENIAVHRKPAQAAPAPVVAAEAPHGPASTPNGSAPRPEASAMSRAAAAIVDEEFKTPPLVMLTDDADDVPARPAAAPKRLAKAPRELPPITLGAAAPPRPHKNVPARPRKPAPASVAPAADTAADSDIALLSAILMHDNRHAGERAQMEAAARCGTGKKCPPPSNLKATD